MKESLNVNAEKARRDALYVCKRIDEVKDTIKKLQVKLDKRCQKLAADGDAETARLICLLMSYHLGEVSYFISQELGEFVCVPQYDFGARVN